MLHSLSEMDPRRVKYQRVVVCSRPRHVPLVIAALATLAAAVACMLVERLVGRTGCSITAAILLGILTVQWVWAILWLRTRVLRDLLVSPVLLTKALVAVSGQSSFEVAKSACSTASNRACIDSETLARTVNDTATMWHDITRASGFVHRDVKLVSRLEVLSD